MTKQNQIDFTPLKDSIIENRIKKEIYRKTIPFFVFIFGLTLVILMAFLISYGILVFVWLNFIGFGLMLLGVYLALIGFVFAFMTR